MVERIFDLIDNYAIKYKDKKDAFSNKIEGKWINYSTIDFIENINLFSSGLLNIGLKKGDKIATISNNRVEWNIVDHAVNQLGIIHVPIYPTLSSEEYRYILEHAEIKLLIVSDKQILQRINQVISSTPNVEHLFTFNQINNERNYSEIIELGKNNFEKNIEIIDNIKKTINKDDLATIIYTSGTTGIPKGVMLSHWNIISNVISTSVIQPLNSNHKVLSFLPLCHIYERMINYQYQYLGIGIYYAESMATIVDNIKEIKPHGFSTVPRLIEKIYDKIISTGKDLGFIKKKIFFWAIDIGLNYELKSNFWYKFKLFIARKLVFSKWKKALGGNIMLIISGGSALQVRLEKVFWAAGIKVVEGYGLTETSPVIASNHYNKANTMFGTVGPIINGVDVMISDDGEILCKGPNVMMGYYKEPVLTNEVIDENGWFHTGDIGQLINNKFLKITDRKKEIFKTTSGKYIAPQMIENKLKESNFIEQAMVIGENEKFASAIISPNFNYLHFWAAKHKVHYRDNCELISIKCVNDRIKKEVDNCNKSLALHEQIKRIKLVCEEWSPQTGELSPTLKLRRKVIMNNYNDLVIEIYKNSQN